MLKDIPIKEKVHDSINHLAADVFLPIPCNKTG